MKYYDSFVYNEVTTSRENRERNKRGAKVGILRRRYVLHKLETIKKFGIPAKEEQIYLFVIVGFSRIRSDEMG